MIRKFYTHGGFFVDETVYRPEVLGSLERPGSVLAFRVYKIPSEEISLKVPIIPQGLLGISYAKRYILTDGTVLEPKKMRGERISIVGVPTDSIDEYGIYPTRQKILYLEISQDKRFAKRHIDSRPLYVPDSQDLKVPEGKTLVVKISEVKNLDGLLDIFNLVSQLQ